MRQCHKSLSNHTTIITAQSTVEFYIWSLKMVHNSHLLHLCFVLYDTATFDEFAVHTDFLTGLKVQEEQILRPKSSSAK